VSDLVIQSIVVGLVAIVSALVGGILPQWIQSLANEKKLKREKLESLYIDIEDWFNNAFNLLYLQFNLVYEGAIGWDEYIEILTKQESKGTFKKSEMTIYLYFNEMEDEYKQLRESIRDVSLLIEGEIKQSYIRGEDIRTFKGLHQKKIDSAIKNMDEVKNHLRKLAKSLG
jgi:hypothetical protein